MPTELAQLLRDAAPEPSRDLDPDQLWAVGRRRRHRRRALVGVSIGVVAIAGIVASTAWLARGEPDRLVAVAGEPVGVSVPTLEGLRLDDARATLQRAGLRGGPADEDPTEAEAVVVAQEPPPDVVVSSGDFVGLRTALVTPELCTVLRDLPDFSNGATWELPVDVLQRVVDVAGPALNADTQRVLDHIRSGGDVPDNAATRALDRLVVHRRACG